MNKPNRIFAGALFILCGLAVSCIHSKSANDAAVEKLRRNLVSENFDEIYNHSSSVTRAQLSRDEFVTKLQAATAELKRFDQEIMWSRNETTLYDRAVFREDNFLSLDLVRDGRKLNVVLDWAPEYSLCGMALVYEDLDNGLGNEVNVFLNCS